MESPGSLPESVESLIQKIYRERNQAPLKMDTRRMLAEIGEHAAVDLLNMVLSAGTIENFSGGYASSPQVSPQTPSMRSPYSAHEHATPQASTQTSNMQSPSSASFSLHTHKNSTSSSPHRTGPDNVSFYRIFDGETQEMRNLNGRHQSLRRDEHWGMTEPRPSQQLMILSQLIYRKLFLVLSYIGRNKLEDVVTVDDAEKIFSMKDLSMMDFESNIWITYGQKFNKEARCEYLDWDTGKTHLYHCHVCQDGSYYFKGPFLNSSRTHLQRSLGDENVLIVKFLEDGTYDTSSIVEDGILVGLRRFHFFVFKDEHKKVKKEKKATHVGCYFVHLDAISKKSIGEARCLFMHVHTLSSVEKYMARFSLILSKTIKLEVDFAAVIIEIIEDIPFKDQNGSIIYDEDRKAILHTDGTGYISEDLAMKCPKTIFAAKYIADNSFEKCQESLELEDITCQRRGSESRNKNPPLLMQCRLFYNGCAVKGTLLVNKKLQQGRIQIRPSMIKVERDRTLSADTFNSMEIVNIRYMY